MSNAMNNTGVMRAGMMALIALFLMSLIGMMYGYVGAWLPLLMGVLIFLKWLPELKLETVEDRRRRLHLECFKGLDEYSLDNKNVDEYGGLAIDEGRRCLLHLPMEGELQVIKLDDVVGYSLVVDDMTVSTGSLTDGLGRAAVGAMVLGSVGALIGGLTGPKREVRYMRRIELKLVVKDIINPDYSIVFFDSNVFLNRSKVKVDKPFDSLIEMRMRLAEKWTNILIISLQ